MPQSIWLIILKSKMLRGFSLRDFGVSLNTVESYTNESS